MATKQEKEQDRAQALQSLRARLAKGVRLHVVNVGRTARAHHVRVFLICGQPEGEGTYLSEITLLVRRALDYRDVRNGEALAMPVGGARPGAEIAHYLGQALEIELLGSEY